MELYQKAKVPLVQEYLQQETVPKRQQSISNATSDHPIEMVEGLPALFRELMMEWYSRQLKQMQQKHQGK